jgi:two-component system, chemotaxis family, CheB/CheR fusion protein
MVFVLHRAPRVARDPELPKALVGVRLLVVEADADARELFDSVLSYCGAFVELAASAREAVHRLEAKPVDVVIVDMQLPGGHAYRLVHELAARSAGGRPVPAIALAAGHDHGPDRTLGAGFQGHLRKPVDPWELCRMVARLARKA